MPVTALSLFLLFSLHKIAMVSYIPMVRSRSSSQEPENVFYCEEPHKSPNSQTIFSVRSAGVQKRLITFQTSVFVSLLKTVMPPMPEIV